MTTDIMKLFMPVMKQADGKFLGILSDTSIDRDNEMMSAALLREWAMYNRTLPALVNHENKMEKLVGGWKNLRVVEKDGRTALVAEPFFFSKEANPLAAQVEKQVVEALENGMNVGISIGARAQDSETVMVGDKAMRQYTKAELLEATWVPIQSNPKASFGHIAKSYGIEVSDDKVEKPAALDRCVEALMADPDFKPEEGRSKEQSAYAVCNARIGKVLKMSEEVHNEEVQSDVQEEAQEAVVEEAAPEAVEEKSEEVSEESSEEVAEEAAEEAAEESEESDAEKATVTTLQKKVYALTQEIEELKKNSGVLKATVEPQREAQVKKTKSLEHMFNVIRK